MPKYEYVSKNEYKPVREELEAIIKKVQNLVRDDFTFQFKLVGSGGKHLITREVGGNKGFDFDYNLILNCDEGKRWKPDFAKKTLMKAFNEAVKGTRYDYPEDSTTAITIKVKDTKHSKIIHSCDFAIIHYPDLEEDEDSYFMYVKHEKQRDKYTWEIRDCSKNYDAKIEWLKDNVNGYWDEIKDEYLKIKEANNNPNKHSFQLYFEAVSNVFNYYYNYA